ncbi:hypothetical protein [Streptacidiphilus rugosus]|uniref:hypothetical protein n=1 Tax=Streptacidiphilus rugosus TaxID=405783 RepID=UPI000AD125AC|nr:hypothetical protein [Streptacidiphilus rugosus]
MPPSPGRGAAAARYLAIASEGNRHLEADFDRLDGRDRARLDAARADLRDAAATERLFDRRLAALALPPETRTLAARLVAANEARADLTATAAGVPTLAGLRADERRLTAANAPVETQVRAIRGSLGLPPPETG